MAGNGSKWAGIDLKKFVSLPESLYSAMALATAWIRHLCSSSYVWRQEA